VKAAVAAKDAKRALRLVHDLARSGRASWPLAVKTLLDLARSIDEDNPLGIIVNDFYKAARQDGFAPLYADAIQNPQAYDAAFRHFAIRELPWTDSDDTTTLLARQLLVEKDRGVARMLAGTLAERPDPEILNDLVASLRAQQDRGVRFGVVEAIAAIPGDDATRALSGLAASEPDKELQQELTLSVQSRQATVAGYLVTSIGDRSQAAQVGMKAGDVLVTYGGTPIASMDDLQKAKQGIGQGQTVVVGVVRDGQTLTFTLKSGQIGIDGRMVKPRS
jgi:hypothetical protein